MRIGLLSTRALKINTFRFALCELEAAARSRYNSAFLSYLLSLFQVLATVPIDIEDDD